MSVPPPIPQTVAVRIAGRLGMDFFLDILRIAGEGRDLMDGLILMTVAHANLSHIDHDPRRPGPFDAYGDPAPIALLRPISMNAVAGSLSQPFETIRRRFAGLRTQGDCDMVESGAIVPPSRLEDERQRVMVFTLNGRARGLYNDLRHLDLMPLPPDEQRLGDLRPRFVARAAIGYALRQLEALTAHVDDPAKGVLLIHVIRATTKHLDNTYAEFDQTDDLVEDHLRRPAPLALLAGRTGLPAETVRRHLAALCAQGWITRSRGGYYLSREMLRAPPWAKARQDNVMNLNRLFTALGAAGVLHAWTRGSLGHSPSRLSPSPPREVG